MPMFKQWRGIIGAITLVVGGWLLTTVFVPLPAQAQGLVPCGGPPPQQACTVNDLFRLGANIFNFLLGMAAVVAILIIVISGLGMITYHWFENPDQVLQGARYTLTRAIFGFIIIAIAYILVNTLIFVLGGGGLQQLFQQFGFGNLGIF